MTATADAADMMGRRDLTDAEYQLVAAVAEREGWSDLSFPPVIAEAARSIAEQEAITRYAQVIPTQRTRRSTQLDPRWARLIMVLLLVGGLIACWVVSPERTALGLIVAGAFCLWSLRRRRRAPAGVPSGRRGLFPLAR